MVKRHNHPHRRTRRADPYRRAARPSIIVLGVVRGMTLVAIRGDDGETVYQRSDGRAFGSPADAMREERTS